METPENNAQPHDFLGEAVEAHDPRFDGFLFAGEGVAGAASVADFAPPSRHVEGTEEHVGMTAGRFKKGGAGIAIYYAGRSCALGALLIARTDQGLCRVQLGDVPRALLAQLQLEFPKATLIHDPHTLTPWLNAFAEFLDGHGRLPEFPLDIQATAFQARVWQAMRKIPYGTTVSYAGLARAIGQPDATRAVASACAKNPVALTIPCHRVVPSTGGVGGYRWDPARKKKLLVLERLG